MHSQKPNGAEKEPSATPPPSAPTETLRRARGTASPPRSQAARVPGFVPTNPDSDKKASGPANGSANHAAAADSSTETRQAGSRVNGQGHAFYSLDAGSDDVSGTPVAIAPARVGAGADRDACAAPAGSQGLYLQTPNKPRQSKRKKRRSSHALLCAEGKSRVPSEASGGSNKRERSPGEEPLPEDPAEFVEEVHSRIDLFEIWQELLKSEDEKIKQRAVEKLTEMRYKGASSMAEEPQQILIDVVRPRRDPQP